MPGSEPAKGKVEFSYAGLENEDNETVLDRVTLLEWQRYVDFDAQKDWQTAKSYCEDLELEGHDDWRLPTRVELDTLVDPAYRVDGVAYDKFGSAVPMRILWTSTPSMFPAGHYLIVSFTGLGFHEEPEEEADVRCVRWTGPPRSEAPRYSFGGTQAEPTTRDERTGLEWQQLIPPKFESCDEAATAYARDCTQGDAVKYCDSLAYGGHEDWRLPNIKDALTLFDPSQKGSLHPEGFPDQTAQTLWTSSEDADISDWFYVTLDAGYGTEEAFIGNRIRCVR
jgi:hypothetical protein